MENSFLPEDYSAPSGKYMKLQSGENRVRILSRPVIGYLDWKDKKPYRFTMQNKPVPMTDKPVKHFWAFVVWNYTESAIQILEITQVSIQKVIQNLSKDEDWGAPFFYDIKINKKGIEKETEYTVTPVPKKNLSDNISKAALETQINLKALFENKDPFTEVKEEVTELYVLPF